MNTHLRSRSKRAMRVFSIGYQGRSLDAFRNALAEAGVRVLVDVRAAAWSQRPQFRKSALAAALKEIGIEYVHCKVAGNPFRPKPGRNRVPAECEKLYARYLENNLEVIEELASLIARKPSALLCYEARRDECHRGVLLEMLSDRQPTLRVEDL